MARSEIATKAIDVPNLENAGFTFASLDSSFGRWASAAGRLEPVAELRGVDWG
jgi:hypothetical protein